MTNTKILILKGSPREKGNSAILAERVAEGARLMGAEVDSIYLHAMDIRACDACEACHENEDGLCIIQDDMQDLYSKIDQADVIVIASPVYWFTVSAQTKLCVDRWYAYSGKTPNILKQKIFSLILVYGDSDPYSSGGINAIRFFEDMCRYLGAPIAGILYGSADEAGDILKQEALLGKAFQLGKKLASV
ncbi:MAG: flavodoxin family protein [Anaerolineales bacterium]|nr:flavodoxin family protein [Anaerolineales bacterium]